MPRPTFVVLLVVFAPLGVHAQPLFTPLPWEVRCFEDAGLSPGECDASVPGSGAAFVTHELDEATEWMRGLGFQEPQIERSENGQRYLAWMGPDSLFLEGDHVYGYYSSSERELTVDGSHFIQFEGRMDATATVTHELFHAVQAAYPKPADPHADGTGWIVEGTAQAVEAAWVAHETGQNPLAPGGHAFSYGFRQYSIPIDAPQGSQKYATSHFWLALGDMIGSAERIVYLQEVLQHADQAPGAVLDAVLRPYHPDGFAHFFPRLLAAYALHTGHFDGVAKFANLTDGMDASADVPIDRLAADFTRFYSHESQPLDVEIHLREDPSIHFVIGGVPVDPQELGDGGIFRTLLMPGDTLTFLAVNVALKAEETIPTTYGIRVRAKVREVCGSATGASFSLSIGGPRGGSGVGSFVFERDSIEMGGRDFVNYPGLTVVDSGGRMDMVWHDRETLGLTEQYDLVRARLGLPNASNVEVVEAFQELEPEDMMRLFPEFMEDEGDDGSMPNGFSVSVSKPDGDGTHSIQFQNNGSQFTIMLPYSGHVGIGRVESSMLNIGVQAPAFVGGMQDGIVLAQPELIFSALDPWGCVAGTFRGIYEEPAEHIHQVVGSFRVNLPNDVQIVTLD